MMKKTFFLYIFVQFIYDHCKMFFFFFSFFWWIITSLDAVWINSFYRCCCCFWLINFFFTSLKNRLDHHHHHYRIKIKWWNRKFFLCFFSTFLVYCISVIVFVVYLCVCVCVCLYFVHFLFLCESHLFCLFFCGFFFIPTLPLLLCRIFFDILIPCVTQVPFFFIEDFHSKINKIWLTKKKCPEFNAGQQKKNSNINEFVSSSS